MVVNVTSLQTYRKHYTDMTTDLTVCFRLLCLKLLKDNVIHRQKLDEELIETNILTFIYTVLQTPDLLSASMLTVVFYMPTVAKNINW